MRFIQVNSFFIFIFFSKLRKFPRKAQILQLMRKCVIILLMLERFLNNSYQMPCLFICFPQRICEKFQYMKAHIENAFLLLHVLKPEIGAQN